MARSLNKAMVIGNLGFDPEVRSTSSETKVATLSVATSRRWNDRSGQEQERTEWHRVVCWDGLAEVAEQYLSKGDRIYVEGRIQYREWEGDDGRTRYTTEIRAREMIMLGGTERRSGSTSSSESERRPVPSSGDPEFPEAELMGPGTADDLPF